MTDRRHECPGHCGRTVPLHLLACSPCWHRLPADLQRAVSLAHRRRQHYPGEHRQAVQDAVAWYRANQPERSPR